MIVPKGHISKVQCAVGVGVALFDGAAVCIDKLEVDTRQSSPGRRIGFRNGDAADSGSVYKGLAHSLSAGRYFNSDRGGIQNVAVRRGGLAQVVSPNGHPGEGQCTVRAGISFLDQIPGCVCELEVSACQCGPGHGIGLEDGDAAGTVGVGDRLGDELTVLGKTDLYRRIVKLITCGSGGLLEDVCPKRKRGKEHLAVLVGVALVDFCSVCVCEDEMDAGEGDTVLIGLDDTDVCVGGVVCESDLFNSACIPDSG